MSEKSKRLIDLDQVVLPLPKKLNDIVLKTAKAGLGVNTLNQYYGELEIVDNFYASTLNKLDNACTMHAYPDADDAKPAAVGKVL